MEGCIKIGKSSPELFDEIILLKYLEVPLVYVCTFSNYFTLIKFKSEVQFLITGRSEMVFWGIKELR